MTLLEAMDTHDLARGRGPYEQVVWRTRQLVLIASVRSDGLYVPCEQYGLARLLPRGEILEIASEQGHDGFLIDAARFEPRLRRFVDRCRRDREGSIRPLREDGRLRGAC